MTREDLIAFEAEVAERFNAGEIRAPVHLAGGNEDNLIRIFQNVLEGDWVLGSWRSHYHCLLKGVPPGRLMADIVAGRSIALCYPEYRVLCSAIVGGQLPIALGIAWSIKRAGGAERVYAFCGDMAAATGIFSETTRYALGHDLPITFIVEDNGVSVCTPTVKAWGSHRAAWVDGYEYRYEHENPWPHSGAGKRINF
jgi:TPP-dependent pyruvate/acetoin dehydrogenase alpha subunit